jgi:hypothetical protein
MRSAGHDPHTTNTETCRGLAVCPLCCNEEPFQLRCRLCRGLGYVGRARRNDYKLGRVGT